MNNTGQIDTTNKLLETAYSTPVSNIKKQPGNKADLFENTLYKAIGANNPTDKAKGLKMNAASGLQEIPSNNFNLIKSSDLVSGQTDKLLGMLDSYLSQLGDPEISLKSISYAAEEMNTNAKNLLKETQKLQVSDNSLKQVATHTIVTAQTEYFKFHRGDYVNNYEV